MENSHISLKSLLKPCLLLLAIYGALTSSLGHAQTAEHAPGAKPALSYVPPTSSKSSSRATVQPGASRVEIRSTASQMAAGIAAAEAALGPAALAIAEQVHTGVLPCELGAFVTVASDPRAPGYFNMHGRNFRYRMVPVVTSTGAVRLEDYKAGAVWLQLSNKSMLMNQKAGKRVADDCKSPAQSTVARAMKEQPPPGLLDQPINAASALAGGDAPP